MKWSDLLKNEEKVIDPDGRTKLFHEWIRDSFAANKPLDQFVRELIAARGSTYKNPPANYYRANRDAVSRAEATAQVFLGIRLGCAKCHNHPFDRWTQDDYYRWTALFARVDYKIVENNRPDDNDKHQFDGEQIVRDRGEGRGRRTRSREQPASRGSLAAPSFRRTIGNDRLTPLADWLASPENELFVRSQANRIWYHLLGRGLVEPIDDFRATNPAVNPALLDALSRDLIEHRFDVRHLVRTIMRSRTYQLSAEPNETNARRRDQLLAGDRQAPFRRATARWADAGHRRVARSLRQRGGPARRAGRRRGRISAARMGERRQRGQRRQHGQRRRKVPQAVRQAAAAVDLRMRTLDRFDFGASVSALKRPDASEDARRAKQSTRRRCSPLTNRHRRLSTTCTGPRSPGPPSDDERAALVAYIEQAPNWRAGLEDVTWSVVNSKEFLLRR